MHGSLVSWTDGGGTGISRAQAVLKTNTLFDKYDVMSGIIAYGTMNLKDILHRIVTFNNCTGDLKRQLGQGNTPVGGDLRG